jgi:hypothetical protein
MCIEISFNGYFSLRTLQAGFAKNKAKSSRFFPLGSISPTTILNIALFSPHRWLPVAFWGLPRKFFRRATFRKKEISKMGFCSFLNVIQWSSSNPKKTEMSTTEMSPNQCLWSSNTLYCPEEQIKNSAGSGILVAVPYYVILRGWVDSGTSSRGLDTTCCCWHAQSSSSFGGLRGLRDASLISQIRRLFVL